MTIPFLDEAENRGFERGIEKTALNMLKKNKTFEEISEITVLISMSKKLRNLLKKLTIKKMTSQNRRKRVFKLLINVFMPKNKKSGLNRKFNFAPQSTAIF